MDEQRQDGESKALTVFQHAGHATRSMIRDLAGVTAIEYGLLAALIAIAILGSVTALGSEISTMYAQIAAQLMAAL